jgi:hypothetical protein
MTPRRLVILFVLALLVIAGAIWLSSQRYLPRDTSMQPPVLPGLAAALNEVKEVRLVTAGEKTAVTLRKNDSGWQVAERGNYRADASKLRRLLIDLSELKVVEKKTATPERYAALGVEDVRNEKATGTRIDLAGPARPASLIVGKTAGGRSSYVRVADQATSVLAAPQVTVDNDPRNWLDHQLLDIAADRVQEVQVKTADAPAYTATRQTREQTDFTVPALPKGKQLSSPTAANSASSALVALTLSDAHPVAADEDWSKDVAHAQFRLFDGTVLDFEGRKDGDHHWVRITPSFDAAQRQRFAIAEQKDEKKDAATGKDAKPAEPAAPAKPKATERKPEEVQADVERMKSTFSGWAFEIPGYKYDSLFRPLKDILKTP